MGQSPSALKILLIEEDARVREVLIQMLASLGHSVLATAGGREGLARLEAGNAVDLVLTDLKMPQMSGWEVVKAVKARWPRLPVGVMTGTPEALLRRGPSVGLKAWFHRRHRQSPDMQFPRESDLGGRSCRWTMAHPRERS